MAGNPMTAAYLFNNPSPHGFITTRPSTSIPTGLFPEQPGEYKRKSCPDRNRGRTLLGGQPSYGLAQETAGNILTINQGAAVRSTRLFGTFCTIGCTTAQNTCDGFNASMNSQTRRGPFLRISHSSRMLMNETALTLCIVATCSAKVLEHR